MGCGRQRLWFSVQPSWLVKQKQIAPHIPVFDRSQRTDGTWSRGDFTWDGKNDRYICPEGKELVQYHGTYATPRTGIDKDGFRRYRATTKDCSVCPSKPVCCPNAPARKIPRDLNEDSRDVARAICKTPGYERSPAPAEESRNAVRSPQTYSTSCRLRLRGPQVPVTSSCSPQPLKTFENWQNSGQ